MKRPAVVTSILAAAVLGSSTIAAPLAADVFTVTTLADSGPGSLRQAVADAVSGDQIRFAVGGTILLTTGEIVIDKDLTIRGPEAASVAVRRDVGAFGRIFSIDGATVSISRLSIENGIVFCCLDGEVGGGIFNDGVLRLASVTLSDNTAPIGGAVYNAPGARLDVINSTLSGNLASDPGFGCDGGGFGGGIGNDGGDVSLRNTTISDNEGPCGGGIYQSGGRVTVVNTIIDEGQFSSPACEIDGGVVDSAGHNLDSDGTCGLGHPRDLPGLDPVLGPLADNGGPTLTHALLGGSPALDAGSLASAPPDDQRGVPRPQGPRVDVGAFELVP